MTARLYIHGFISLFSLNLALPLWHRPNNKPHSLYRESNMDHDHFFEGCLNDSEQWFDFVHRVENQPKCSDHLAPNISMRCFKGETAFQWRITDSLMSAAESTVPLSSHLLPFNPSVVILADIRPDCSRRCSVEKPPQLCELIHICKAGHAGVLFAKVLLSLCCASVARYSYLLHHGCCQSPDSCVAEEK